MLLARARAADDPEDIASGDVQVDVVQGLELALGRSIGLADVRYPDHCIEPHKRRRKGEGGNSRVSSARAVRL